MAEAPEIPTANSVAENGLSHIPQYVGKLFASIKPAAVLMISTLDGQGSLTLLHMGSRTHLNLAAGWSRGALQDTVAAQCVSGLGGTLEEKEQNGTRILSFSMKGDAQRVTYVATTVMTQIYGVQVHEGLKFRFDEWSF